jgi:uncharacterized protein (UPF0212 family)
MACILMIFVLSRNAYNVAFHYIFETSNDLRFIDNNHGDFSCILCGRSFYPIFMSILNKAFFRACFSVGKTIPRW